MVNLCAKLTQKENNKYRKIISIDQTIYSNSNIQIHTSTPYIPGAALEDGEWFKIENASRQKYKIDLMSEKYSTLDFTTLAEDEIKKIEYIFFEKDNQIYFQNVSKSKLVSRKSVICLGENFTYHDNKKEIVINDMPDAVYDKNKDVLYFRRLESITSIFSGIDQLFKEATDEETSNFLSSTFIKLKNDYNASRVKTANRKRIALAQKTLDALDSDSRENIFVYIGEYCPELKTSNNSFELGTEDELKMLLYGIEQRFYTTIVGGEKRIANSVIPLGK